MFYCLKKAKTYIMKMNNYKINPLLIHVKEKEQSMRANYVVLSVQNAHPILNGIVSLDTGEFFSRNL